MKVCVLHPSYQDSESPCNGMDPDGVPELWKEEGQEFTSVHLKKATSARDIGRLATEKFDVFLNLCDGAWDEDRPGIDVVMALEKLNLPFTGARSHFYEPSKEEMKLVALYHGIPTPAFRICGSEENAVAAAEALKFPLIVKHKSGYNSIGMTAASKCNNSTELVEQVKQMVEKFGPALVEEFISGHEYTVLVSECPGGPEPVVAYQPVECMFPAGEDFKHFNMKFVDHKGLKWVPVKDPSLNSELRSMAVQMFKALRGTGYGRIDVRGDREGNIFFLEMNPNCGIFYPPDDPGSADIILLHEPDGHKTFLQRILNAAVLGHQRRQPKFRVELSGTGHGLFASRDIAAGEIIDELEETAFHLVTKNHAAASWDHQKKTWFQQYAWPLSENVWAMWSPEPSAWKPINHSCDPNSWLTGLNVAARRDISSGEEITIDYATFCVESEAFTCRCSASICRKIVTGRDYLAPWLGQRYGNHISDFVRLARIQASGPAAAEQDKPVLRGSGSALAKDIGNLMK